MRPNVNMDLASDLLDAYKAERDSNGYGGTVRVDRYYAEAFNLPVREDADQEDWNPLGGSVSEKDRTESVGQVRWLSKNQPNVKRALSLYGSYTLGRAFRMSLVPREESDKLTAAQKKTIADADRAWRDFLRANRKWWNFSQLSNRVYRDGESFTFKLPKASGDVPQVRFVDPEEIADPGDQKGPPSGSIIADNYDGEVGHKGIVTSPDDINDIKAYLRINTSTQELLANIKADQMFHTKIDSDSTEKRGLTRFYSVIWFARKHQNFVQVEIDHRTLQASLVLQRTIKGSPNRLSTFLDNQQTSTTEYPEGPMRREKIRSGSIITQNEGVELEFRQPMSNFSDASPLGRLLILQIAAATGWPYFAISSDSSESNFASTLVQESPVVLMVQDEQDMFAGELEPIYRWVIEEARVAGLMKRRSAKDVFKDFKVEFTFPSLATRDMLASAQGDNILVMARSISTQEMGRRAGVDPDKMAREIKEKAEQDVADGLGIPAMMGMNQTNSQKGRNARDNQGDGQNAGDNQVISHDDSLT